MKIIDGFNVRTRKPIDCRYQTSDLSKIMLPYEGLIVWHTIEKIFYKYSDGEFKKLLGDMESNIIAMNKDLITLDNTLTSLNNRIMMMDFINVKDYGARGDGTTDDTSSFNEAIANAKNGSIIYIPIGTYKLGNISITNKRLTFRGETGFNTAGSVFLSNGDNIMFDINKEGVSFYNICFNSTDQRLGGCYIKETGVYRASIVDCAFLSHYSAIQIDNGSSEINIDKCQFMVGTPSSVKSGSNFIVLGKTGYVAPVTITNCLMRNDWTHDTEFGIRLYYTDGVNISNTTINCCGIGISVNPQNGQTNTYTIISNCVIDSCKYDGIGFVPEGTGRVFRHIVESSWCGNNQRTNIAINGSSSNAVLDSITIHNNMLEEGQYGINVDGDIIKAINISQNFIGGVTATALRINGACQRIKVHDNFIGNYGFPNLPNNTNITSSDNSVVEFYRNTLTDATNPNGIGFNTQLGINNGLGYKGYTPTISSSVGAIASYTASGKYIVDGNRVSFESTATITSKGTGDGAILFGLPKPCKNSITVTIRIGAFSGSGYCQAGAQNLALFKYDGTYPIANDGDTIYITGSYELG